MPANYAHYHYGELIKEALKENNKIISLINSNLNEFELGLHGPDVLFYNSPFKKNDINTLGNNMHDVVARSFFIKSKEIYLKDDLKSDKELSYLLGFLCHYTLDSNCHPLVEEYMKIEDATHFEVESSLDRHLLIKDNKDPLRTDLTKHFKYKKDVRDIVAKYFEIDKKEAKISIKTMKKLGKIIRLPRKRERDLVENLLKKLGAEKFKHILVPFTDNLKCKESDEKITEAMYNCVEEGKNIIIDYYEFVKNNTPLKEDALNKTYEG